jgi:hypothetical protein
MARRAELTGRKPCVTADVVELASGPPIPNEIAPTPPAAPKAAKLRAKPMIRGPPIERLAYSIPSFCEAFEISLDTYYRMARAGTGPEIMKIRGSTRIAVEDAKIWQAKQKAVARERRLKTKTSA